MKLCSPGKATNSAFTLVEVLIVVLIMAVLAAVVVQQQTASTNDAKIALVQQHLSAMKNQIELQKALHGSYPLEIEADWFAGGIPKHPFNDGSVPDIHVLATFPDRQHPQYKIIDQFGAYWYNPKNGMIRARIPNQRTTAKTLAAYNYIHNSKLTLLSQTN
ncbi:MAG: prepilin-type N-terminal cleavage/methylation domain-containing protein [Pirellulaceae bacterium]|jgi:prepilin-type N-terminal cleavage/methylation domain-containing protein